MASPSAGAPALKYGYVNTVTTSHGVVKGLIAGGIYSGGLTGWIINEGTLNEFAYAQVLLFYKDSYKELKKKIK